MTTSAKRVRALREGERRSRSFTIGVSEDDLRVIAKNGYEGALSSDPDQRARTLSLFIADMLAARRPSNGVTAVATSNGFVCTSSRRRGDHHGDVG